jgi:hypothetical protein
MKNDNGCLGIYSDGGVVGTKIKVILYIFMNPYSVLMVK